MPEFNSIEDFLEYLPQSERSIVDSLRSLIMSCIPEATERLSYNVPYYYRYSRICFIWPSSVPWGKVRMEGVKLGFCQGHFLNDNGQYLERGNRKQVYTKTFFEITEIDPELIKSYLYEAAEIDLRISKTSSHF